MEITTQAQLVYTSLLNGSTYTHIGGYNALKMGCYQRIISLLRNEYSLPIAADRINNADGKGWHYLYYMDADTRAELMLADAQTPTQALRYYNEKYAAQFKK